MKNSSFQLIRTNPRLTTNIKFVVSSDDNLYLESFNASSDLSKDKYKHYLLKTNSSIENDFPKYYDGLSKTLAFTPYTFNDVSVMYNNYEFQFDEMYYSGANEIEDTWYKEEFEYFAPLYVIKGSLPSNFIVMRVDDPAIYAKKGVNYTIDNLRNDNFKSEIIDKWKCVSVFDMSANSNLGQFLKRNIEDNTRFPDYSFFFDIKRNNFSKYAGMKYETGIYTTSEFFLNDKLEKQNTHYDLENYITRGFERTGIVYPYIFNFKFLFDDAPATPDKFLKYSMNRYYGFYTDSLELINTITTYDLPELKDNLTIKNNIFVDSRGSYLNPYKSIIADSQWVQCNNEIYEIRKQINGSYKIISDVDLSGLNASLFNKGKALINNNAIIPANGSVFSNIDTYKDSNGETEQMYADLYLIEIDGLYHVLKNDYTKVVNNGITTFTNNFNIQTDYNISSNKDVLEYYKGGKQIDYNDPQNIYNYDRSILNTIDVLSNINVFNYYKREDGIYNLKKVFDSKPLVYKIYRVNFSNIKDFDFDRLNTGYADFDYEKSTYVETLEKKLYFTELRDKNTPKKNEVNRLDEDGQYKPMIISSEYISDGELYEIRKNNVLNPMWDKTQTINKWEYRNSISHSDYPYKINNSSEQGGIYNRTVNTDLNVSNMTEKTLDYFYRIGELYGKEDSPLISGPGMVTDWKLFKKDGTEFISNNQVSVINNALVVDFNSTVMLDRYVQLNLNSIVLEKDTDYFVSVDINLTKELVSLTGTTFEVGFSNDTFDNQSIKYDLSDITTLSFIGKSKSTTLSFIVDFSHNEKSYLYVEFNNLKVYKMVNKYYYNQSTNIQTSLLNPYDNVTNDKRFNLDYYISSKFDYFEQFFSNTMYYEDYGKLYKKPYTKYSIFSGGTSTLPAKTLFKGIEYELYGIKDMMLSTPIGSKEKITTIISDGGLDYNGYKMSVILSENYSYWKFKYDRVDFRNITSAPENWIEDSSVIGNNDGYISASIDKVENTHGYIFDVKWNVHDKQFTPNAVPTKPINANNNDGSITITLTEVK